MNYKNQNYRIIPSALKTIAEDERRQKEEALAREQQLLAQSFNALHRNGLSIEQLDATFSISKEDVLQMLQG